MATQRAAQAGHILIPRAEQPKQVSVGLFVAAIAALLAALAVAVWLFFFDGGRARPQPPEAPVAAPAPAPAPAVAPPPVPPEQVQALLASLSPNPLYRRWLAEPDPLHRFAVLADNFAEDVSPRAQLGFLKPTQPFSAQQSRGRTVAAPASFARYDAFAEAVASIDAAAFAGVFRTLHPVLEWTYRQLGYPSANLDVVAAQALSRIVAAPANAKDGAPPALVTKGALYLYADRDLEALGPIEKHVLRLGPHNARLVQEKARELRAALGLPEVKVAPR